MPGNGECTTLARSPPHLVASSGWQCPCHDTAGGPALWARAARGFTNVSHTTLVPDRRCHASPATLSWAQKILSDPVLVLVIRESGEIQRASSSAAHPCDSAATRSAAPRFCARHRLGCIFKKQLPHASSCPGTAAVPGDHASGEPPAPQPWLPGSAMKAFEDQDASMEPAAAPVYTNTQTCMPLRPPSPPCIPLSRRRTWWTSCGLWTMAGWR